MQRFSQAIQTLSNVWLRCAAIKADVAMNDERKVIYADQFWAYRGHGLEAAARYQRIKHGEAVGYGMIAAARIGHALQKICDSDRARIEAAVRSVGRLPALNGVNSKDVLNALQHDKKVRDGAIHFVLPRAVGRVEITPDVPFEVVRSVVKEILNDGKRLPGPG
jgi:3-dehydroquinate synthase